jgi:uncharacterized membrane protein HdeD (DUF308 family)
MGWWERWQQRQQELAAGADADLVRDNRKKQRWSTVLFGAGLLLLLVLARFRPWKTLGTIGAVVGVVLLIAGSLLGKWARAESSFLDEPDPEKPPSIFKG